MENVTLLEIRPDALAFAVVGPSVSSGRAPLASRDAEGIAAALKAAGAPEDLRRVRLVIPRGQALLRDLTLPEAEPEELVAMVRFQVEREIPLPLEQMRYSYIETGRSGGSVRVQVVSIARKDLDPLLAALEGAGLVVESVTITSFGLLHLVPDGLGIEVVGGETELILARNGRMEASRLTSVTDLEGLSGEIGRTLHSWSAKIPEGETLKVVLAGEGPEADQLAKGLRGRLEREVEVTGDGGLETAALVGLGRAMLAGASIPDVLHPPVAVKRFRVTKRHRIIAGVVGGLLLLVLGTQLMLSLRSGNLEEKRAELRKLAPRAEEISTMARRSALVHHWYRDRHSWARTLDELQKHIDRKDIWLASATFDETGAVRIVGKARGDKPVPELVARLKQEGHFSDITIDKVAPAKSDGKYTKDFSVSARILGVAIKRSKP